MFCTDQTGPGKLPFTKDTGISLDRQESTGGKTAWLAPLGSPQEVNNCLCRKTLTLEETLDAAISRVPRVLQLMHSKVQATHVPHTTLPAWRMKLRNKSSALRHANLELSFNLCVPGCPVLYVRFVWGRLPIDLCAQQPQIIQSRQFLGVF